MFKYETVFKKTFLKLQNGLYQEIIKHFIVTTNKKTGVITSQFDKEIKGRLYKKKTVSDIGINGYEEFFDENLNETILLIAIQ